MPASKWNQAAAAAAATAAESVAPVGTTFVISSSPPLNQNPSTDHIYIYIAQCCK